MSGAHSVPTRSANVFRIFLFLTTTASLCGVPILFFALEGSLAWWFVGVVLISGWCFLRSGQEYGAQAMFRALAGPSDKSVGWVGRDLWAFQEAARRIAQEEGSRLRLKSSLGCAAPVALFGVPWLFFTLEGSLAWWFVGVVLISGWSCFWLAVPAGEKTTIELLEGRIRTANEYGAAAAYGPLDGRLVAIRKRANERRKPPGL